MNMVIWWHPSYWYLFVCTTLLHVVHRFLIMRWIGRAVLPHENLLLSLKPLHNNQPLLALYPTMNQLIKWWNQSYYFYINPCPEHYYPHSTPPPWKHQRYPYSPPPATCLPPKILLLNLGHTVKNALDLIRYLELEGFHPYSISRFVFCFFSMEQGGVGFGIPPPDATVGVLRRGVHVRPFSVWFS